MSSLLLPTDTTFQNRVHYTFDCGICDGNVDISYVIGNLLTMCTGEHGNVLEKGANWSWFAPS
jgi:hypothetical protein